jgi:dihydroorotate dehydrogenase
MGVGGIFTGRDIFDKIALGAHLCQVYTGWIYGGPHMVPDALEELVLLIEREGIKSLADLRGVAQLPG